MKKSYKGIVAWLLIVCFSFSNSAVLGVAEVFAYSNLRAISTGNSGTLGKMLNDVTSLKSIDDGGVAANKLVNPLSEYVIERSGKGLLDFLALMPQRVAINNGTAHGNNYDSLGNLIQTQMNLKMTKAIVEAMAALNIKIVQHGVTGTPIENLDALRDVGIRAAHVGTNWQNIVWETMVKVAPKNAKVQALMDAMVDELIKKFGDKYGVADRKTADPKKLEKLIGKELKNILGKFYTELSDMPADVKNQINAATESNAIEHMQGFGSDGTGTLVQNYLKANGVSVADYASLPGYYIFKALENTDKTIMCTNIRTPLSIEGIVRAAMKTDSVVIFQQAMSELGYTWPNGYDPENSAKLAQNIKDVCQRLGFTNFAIKGDHVTVNIDGKDQLKQYIADLDAQKIVSKLFEKILREKDISKRDAMFTDALNAKYSNANVLNVLKSVDKALKLIKAEVANDFTVFALDASFMPVESNVRITSFLAGYIPASAGLEAEVGEIGGDKNSSVADVLEFLTGIRYKEVILTDAQGAEYAQLVTKNDVKISKVYSNVLAKLNAWKQGQNLKLTQSELNSVIWQLQNYRSNDDYMQMKRIVHRLNKAQLDSLKKSAEKKGFGRAFEKVATKTKVVVTAANALIFWAGAFNALMENYEPSMEIVAFKMLKGKKDYTVSQLVELNTHLNGPFTPYKVEGLVPAKGKISNGLEGDAKKEVEALFVPGSKDLGRPDMTIPVFSGEYNGDQMMEFLEAKGLAVDVIAKYGPAKETDTINQYLPYLKRGIPIAAASPINGDLKKLMVEAGYSADSVKEALYSTGRNAIDDKVLIVDTLTCTSNAMLSIIKAILDAYGIDTGSGITVHAATDSNEFFFGPSGRARSPEDLLRGMSIYNNIQTAGTGAAANLFKIAPDLLGNFIIKAVRTSNVTGSFWFLTINLKNPPADVAEFKAKLKEFAQKQSDGVVKYYEGDEGDSWAPLESNRIVGWNNISIIDGFNIEMTANKKTVTVGGFYDNQEAAPWQITGKWAPWMSYVRESKVVRKLVEESKGTLSDGGERSAIKLAKIFSENVIKGSVKADDVGRVVTIAKLKEEGLDGALLGHSATRRAFINELTVQIEKALLAAGIDAKTAKTAARKQAFKRFDELMNERMQDLLNAGVSSVPLCVGSDIKEVTLAEQIADITSQLEVSFNGVEKAKLLNTKLYVAFEPTNLIGKIAEAGAGADVAAEVGMIRDVHQAIYNWFTTKYGSDFAKTVNILYGASVSGDNVDRIMAVTSEQVGMQGYPLVHGALFASSGKKVDGFLAVAEGINRAGKRDGKQYTCFVNLKSFARKDKTSPMEYMAKIKQSVETEKISLTNVELAIADQDIHLKEWQSAADAVKAGVSLTGEDGGSLALDVLTIDDISNWKGLTAALRIDTNAGLVDGKIQKSKKSEKAAQTIKELSDKGAKLVILDHQAKKGEADFLENLESMATLLSELSGKNIKYVDALTGKEVEDAVNAMQDGDVIMLKNVRIDDSETAESTPEEHSRDAMVRTIEPLIDVFVNDAFSTAHRNQRSIVGFTGVPNVAGRLMETEIRGIAPVISLNAKPFVMSLGGGKAEDYLSMMKQVLKEGRVDTIVTGGLLGQLCLVAKGYKLGAPTEDFMRAKFDKAYKKKGGYDAMIKELQFMLENYGDKIIMPADLAYVDAQGNRKEMKVTEENKEVALNNEFSFGDIGVETANKYASILGAAKATYVKGPMGAYENEKLRLGTKIVFTAAVANSKKTVDEKSEKAISLGGGGDTGQVLKLLGLSGFTFESTSGGGVIEAIKVGLHNLPGIKAMLKSGKTVMPLARDRKDIAQSEAVDGVIADKRVHNAQAGEEYKDFINSQLGLLEDEALQKDPRAVVFSQEFFKNAGSKAAVAELAALSKILKVAIYGNSAYELKMLLGRDDILIAGTLKDVLWQLTGANVNVSNNIVVIRTAQDMVDFSTAFKVKQLVAGKDAPAALFIAKAVNELFKKRNTNETFARLFELMSKKNVVAKETYDAVKTSMLATLDKSNIGDFSSVTVSEVVANKVEGSRKIASDFMNKV